MDKSATKPVIRQTSDPDAIENAAALLRDGKLVAFPTETVYGLGADATSERAVASVFEAKNRPQFNPLIVHVARQESALAIGVFSDSAKLLAERFWPGPLTLVVPRAAACPVAMLASAGLDTIAVRVPAHPVARDLLERAGVPVVAPSANPSGQVSPTTARHVAEGLGGEVAAIVDGGPCEIGLESTIVGFDGDTPLLLRAGGIPRVAIEEALGRPLANPVHDSAAPTAPGQLTSHYAPEAAVRLNAVDIADGEALLAFGPHTPICDGPELNLSPSGDLVEAAANLFAYLRQLDATGATCIAVSPIPETGLGEAINDRLRRAAAPRR